MPQWITDLVVKENKNKNMNLRICCVVWKKLGSTLWVLGIEPWSFGRAISAINRQAILTTEISPTSLAHILVVLFSKKHGVFIIFICEKHRRGNNNHHKK